MMAIKISDIPPQGITIEIEDSIDLHAFQPRDRLGRHACAGGERLDFFRGDHLTLAQAARLAQTTRCETSHGKPFADRDR